MVESGTDTDDIVRSLADAARRWLRGFSNDVPVIVVPVFNAFDDVVECVESLLATLPPTVPLLVLDDASDDDRIGDTLSPLAAQRGFHYARIPANGGFVATMNLAFAWTAPHDVVLVNSDVVVPRGWLDRLNAAAHVRLSVATATPLTNHGSILSVPYRGTPIGALPRGLTLHEMDARIQRAAQRLYPVIPTAIGHCTYFNRHALNVVGYFDLAFSPGYGEEVDFSQRAVAAGFCHVVADDLFVYHKGSRSFAGVHDPARHAAVRKTQERRERKIAARYPWYHPWVRLAVRTTDTPLDRALTAACGAILGTRIVVDATCIGDMLTGTQIATIELVRALHATKPDHAHLAIAVGDHVDRRMLLGLDELVDEIIPLSALERSPPSAFDLIHRPFQVHRDDELALLQRVARRCVVTQLDLISFSNPSYFPTVADWLRLRSLTKRVAASVDGMLFISADAASDAAQQGIDIPPGRGRVTYVGTDHRTAEYPPGVTRRDHEVPSVPFLLMLGTNFRHKNRVYALRLFRSLVERYDWNGEMVFAGPSLETGGSGGEEARERLEHPALADRLHYREHIDEGEKWELLRRAAVVMYPSICEGFGIVPFEAARVGTPAITARASAVAEVLGDAVCYLELRDIDVDADAVWSLLTDARCATQQIEGIAARAAAFTWRNVAATTWDFYLHILRLPSRASAPDTTNIAEEHRKLQARAQKMEEEHRGLQTWARTMESDYRQMEEWARELNAQLSARQDDIEGARARNRLHGIVQRATRWRPAR